ncbi:hypothetical protein PLICRDRAFT_42219 [Plicaturopsis crispa FD-325 SS-3]|nr:hypothetical protein PLICRDRAFT_42219 [Plicaturopsis crispa FD-325 SS-3]
MSTVHLLVLIHGMWGNPSHLSELDRIIRETKAKLHDTEADAELRVLLPKTNSDEYSYDGVDYGGERVAQEIVDEVTEIERNGKKVSRFSITGYSLGGLVARYVVGILHQRQFFKDVSPINFNTFATPHIGLPRYSSVLSSLFHTLGPKLLSRTGEQFYCVDKWSANGRPLLEVMADPDRLFFQGLALFPHIRIYANAVNDVTVPYCTAAIELDDPFVDFDKSGVEVELMEEYTPLIKSYTVPPEPPARPTVLSTTWFRSLKAPRPFLPPMLTFRFPLNLVFYCLVPVIIPTALSLVIVRLYLSSRNSRSRIKMLEKDETNGMKLIHIFEQLEQQVENAVVDLIDETDPDPTLEAIEGSPDSASTTVAVAKEKGKTTKASSQQPVLTPLQHKLVANLNTLPNLKKERAFIYPVRNSHAVIVCRDVKRFPLHGMGEGILRHWADEFVL